MRWGDVLGALQGPCEGGERGVQGCCVSRRPDAESDAESNDQSDAESDDQSDDQSNDQSDNQSDDQFDDQSDAGSGFKVSR